MKLYLGSFDGVDGPDTTDYESPSASFPGMDVYEYVSFLLINKIIRI